MRTNACLHVVVRILFVKKVRSCKRVHDSICVEDYGEYNTREKAELFRGRGRQDKTWHNV